MLLITLMLACHGGRPEPDLLQRLQDLDAVVSVSVGASPDPGSFDLIYLVVEQPLDHDAPGAGTFDQHLSLQHRSLDAPMVMRSTGYNDYAGGRDSEPSWMLEANQITVEHRFYGLSRPSDVDWSLLTMAQSSADMHEVVQMLKEVYEGRWISTGGSKGGETVLHHRAHYQDDLDGTIAYVAPLLTAAEDDRAVTFFDEVGDDDACRQQVRDVQRHLMENRSALAADLDDTNLNRVSPDQAIGWSISELEWYFWQYSADCRDVPTVGSLRSETDFLFSLSNPYGYTDAELVKLLEQYVYQSFAELGAPIVPEDHLADLMTAADDDFTPLLPDGEQPTYSNATVLDLLDRIATDGDGLMLIYGEYDPWTRFSVPLGSATDSYSYTAPRGHHGSWIADLEVADREEALDVMSRWADVTARPSWTGNRREDERPWREERVGRLPR